MTIEVTVKTDAKEKRTITIIVGGAEKEEILCESFSVPRTANVSCYRGRNTRFGIPQRGLRFTSKAQVRGDCVMPKETIDKFHWHCPLLNRVIEIGLCYEVNAGIDECLKKSSVPEVTNWEKAKQICPSCPVSYYADSDCR